LTGEIIPLSIAITKLMALPNFDFGRFDSRENFSFAYPTLPLWHFWQWACSWPKAVFPSWHPPVPQYLPDLFAPLFPSISVELTTC
jgi:hypothetical protein